MGRCNPRAVLGSIGLAVVSFRNNWLIKAFNHYLLRSVTAAPHGPSWSADDVGPCVRVVEMHLSYNMIIFYSPQHGS